MYRYFQYWAEYKSDHYQLVYIAQEGQTRIDNVHGEFSSFYGCEKSCHLRAVV